MATLWLETTIGASKVTRGAGRLGGAASGRDGASCDGGPIGASADPVAMTAGWAWMSLPTGTGVAVAATKVGLWSLGSWPGWGAAGEPLPEPDPGPTGAPAAVGLGSAAAEPVTAGEGLAGGAVATGGGPAGPPAPAGGTDAGDGAAATAEVAVTIETMTTTSVTSACRGAERDGVWGVEVKVKGSG